MLCVIMLTAAFSHCYAECHYAECHYAEYRYAECHYAECQYAECHYAECRYAECRYAECRGARSVRDKTFLYLTLRLPANKLECLNLACFKKLFCCISVIIK
jgi:hypothetical protein